MLKLNFKKIIHIYPHTDFDVSDTFKQSCDTDMFVAVLHHLFFK